jgi:large subunit ribosomal protein L24
MQKIIRRVATAERVVAKRQKARDLKWFKKGKKEQKEQSNQHVSAARRELENAKQAIRDDWAMGSLAPRHDVGEWEGAHGAIGESRFSSPGKFSLAMRNARCQWAGGAYYLNLAVGDRVVMLDGPDKGRIGKVSEINHDTAEVTVAGLNKVRLSLYFLPGAGVFRGNTLP